MKTSHNHIDLFSGLGGFSLASRWAGFVTEVFCEKDKFCQKILNKHWPNTPIVEDIFEFDGKKHIGATLLTGGVPCQPASEAGKRRGTKDHRWLWPEALRVIRESRPKWVILENPRGIVTLGGGVEFENLFLEMEREGYETRAFNLPACGVDAPHRRERIWIVAHTDSHRSGSEVRDVGDEGRRPSKEGGTSLPYHPGWQKSATNNDTESSGCSRRASPDPSILAHSTGVTGDGWENNPRIDRIQTTRGTEAGECYSERVLADSDSQRELQQKRTLGKKRRWSSDGCEIMAYSKSIGVELLQPRVEAHIRTIGKGYGGVGTHPAEWLPSRGIRRISDGVPNRVHRLRGLGNAIVPQVAYQIISAIRDIEDKNP